MEETDLYGFRKAADFLTDVVHTASMGLLEIRRKHLVASIEKMSESLNNAIEEHEVTPRWRLFKRGQLRSRIIQLKQKLAHNEKELNALMKELLRQANH